MDVRFSVPRKMPRKDFEALRSGVLKAFPDASHKEAREILDTGKVTLSGRAAAKFIKTTHKLPRR